MKAPISLILPLLTLLLLGPTACTVPVGESSETSESTSSTDDDDWEAAEERQKAEARKKPLNQGKIESIYLNRFPHYGFMEVDLHYHTGSLSFLVKTLDWEEAIYLAGFRSGLPVEEAIKREGICYDQPKGGKVDGYHSMWESGREIPDTRIFSESPLRATAYLDPEDGYSEVEFYCATSTFIVEIPGAEQETALQQAVERLNLPEGWLTEIPVEWVVIGSASNEDETDQKDEEPEPEWESPLTSPVDVLHPTAIYVHSYPKRRVSEIEFEYENDHINFMVGGSSPEERLLTAARVLGITKEGLDTLDRCYWPESYWDEFEDRPPLRESVHMADRVVEDIVVGVDSGKSYSTVSFKYPSFNTWIYSSERDPEKAVKEVATRLGIPASQWANTDIMVLQDSPSDFEEISDEDLHAQYVRERGLPFREGELFSISAWACKELNKTRVSVDFLTAEFDLSVEGTNKEQTLAKVSKLLDYPLNKLKAVDFSVTWEKRSEFINDPIATRTIHQLADAPIDYVWIYDYDDDEDEYMTVSIHYGTWTLDIQTNTQYKNEALKFAARRLGFPRDIFQGVEVEVL